MYEGFKTNTKWQIGYNGVFMARRFIFLYICFYLAENVSVQLIAINALNLIILVYTGQNQV